MFDCLSPPSTLPRLILKQQFYTQGQVKKPHIDAGAMGAKEAETLEEDIEGPLALAFTDGRGGSVKVFATFPLIRIEGGMKTYWTCLMMEKCACSLHDIFYKRAHQFPSLPAEVRVAILCHVGLTLGKALILYDANKICSGSATTYLPPILTPPQAM